MNPTNEELALAFQQGDSKALDCLWEANQGLFSQLCFRYYSEFKNVCDRCGVQLEDLKQETFLALREAAQSFDTDRKVKLTSWMSYFLKRRFHGLLGWRSGKRPLNGAVSLDLPVGEEKETLLGDLQPDPSAAEAFDQAEQSIYQQQLHTALEDGLHDLSEGCAEIVRRLYFEGQTSGQVARQMGCKVTDVNRQKRNALRQLSKNERLRRFLDSTSISYTGVGFQCWKHNGSVQERLVERIDTPSKEGV